MHNVIMSKIYVWMALRGFLRLSFSRVLREQRELHLAKKGD